MLYYKNYWRDELVFKRITLIGLGLIASSIALSVKEKWKKVEINGYDICPNVRKSARKIKLCHVKDKLNEAVKGANLVILCVPVGQIPEVIKDLSEEITSEMIITDVGSVKLSLIESLVPILQEKMNCFVPGHPIAGTENSGPESGFSGLFEGRWCILTPQELTDSNAVMKVKNFWSSLGMNIKIMSPEHHDLVLAVTSHAPHLIAYTMVGVVNDLETVTESEIINYSAAGFRDFTRIAASDPTMWRDIFLNNKKAHLEVLGRFTEELFSLQRAIRREDGDYLLKYFKRTRDIRKSIVEAGQDTKNPDFGRN